MDVESLDSSIAELVHLFQGAPLHYFSEQELHGEFFSLCRRRFGSEKPSDLDELIPLFRHEYNTIGKYRRGSRGSSFLERLSDGGVTGSLDFAILNREFVRRNDLLTVINKDEYRRCGHRSSSTDALDAAIEFKMAHIRDVRTVRRSAINCLRLGMRDDSRKLAHEAPKHAYLLAFIHPSGSDLSAEVREIVGQASSTFTSILRGSNQLRLLFASADPTTTFLYGPWTGTHRFSKVVPLGP